VGLYLTTAKAISLKEVAFLFLKSCSCCGSPSDSEDFGEVNYAVNASGAVYDTIEFYRPLKILFHL